jgi:hypothetical protein
MDSPSTLDSPSALDSPSTLAPFRKSRRKKPHELKRTFYSESDLEIIRSHFDPFNCKKSCELIQKKFFPDKTLAAIMGKASKMGLQRPLRSRPWTQGELDLLSGNVGETLAEIYRQLQSYWKKHGLSPMSIPTLRRRAVIMGHGSPYASGKYFTRDQLAAGMGCSVFVISTWLKDPKFKAILKPQRLFPEESRSPLFFHVKSIKNFVKAYPGEIAKCRPDMVWLLAIVFEADFW